MRASDSPDRLVRQETATLTWILLSMLGLKMYMPALILLETKTCGFSTKRWIFPLSASNTTTPYFDGSSTRVTFTHIKHLHLRSLLTSGESEEEHFKKITHGCPLKEERKTDAIKKDSTTKSFSFLVLESFDIRDEQTERPTSGVLLEGQRDRQKFSFPGTATVRYKADSFSR